MASNPILHKLSSFGIYILFWLIITAIYFILLVTGASLPLNVLLIDALVFNLFLCGLGISFWYSAKFIPVENYSIYKLFLIHIAGGISASVIWLSGGYYFIKEIIPFADDYREFFNQTLNWRFFTGLLFYFSITSFYYIIIYYSNFQERLITESELKNLVSEAELRSLKFQINPHFVFNSLNSMSALTTIEPSRAKEMILKLADFLRFTLANNDKQKNKLAEELNNIKLYLDIEKIRFEDKFEYFESVDDECKNVEVPNMILQPLFENAVKHAVYEAFDKVTLHLTCKSHNGFLKISLQNNFEENVGLKKGAGVGLKNIKSRLELIYNQKNLLEVKKEENNFTVNIFIPLN